jgi:hypothetical protein
VRLEGLGKLRKYTSSGTRTGDLPACSIVPQPTTLPGATFPVVIYRKISLSFLPLAPLLGSLPQYWSTGLITQFLDHSQAVGLLDRVISSSQVLYIYTGQHNHRKMRTQINICAQFGIRPRNHGTRAIEDSSCLRPLGCRDRQKFH